MHEDQGRDIPPDEDRLNYISLPSGDLDADTSHSPQQLGLENALQRNGNLRGNIRLHEPVDATPDAIGSIERRVFPSSRRQGTNAPDYYKSEENRLSTFRDWRYQRTVAKEALARNGFVFTGTGDRVRCIYCNVILRQWEHGDVVEEEHRKNSSQCPFIRGENVGNVPSNSANGHHSSPPSHGPEVRSRTLVDRDQGHDIDPIEDRCGAHNASQHAYTNGYHVSDAVSSPRNAYSSAPKNPRMAVEPDRLETFHAWPAQMKQKPKQLAQAGLYYTGDGDKVKCFHCDVLLYNWEPEDDPFVEHARWFPECEYIRLVKGEGFVQDVKSGKKVLDQVMETPAVLAVLSEGHSVETVKRAVDAIRTREGSGTVISADKLLNTVLEMEEAENGTARQVNGTQTPEDMQKLREEYEGLREKQQCKICMDNDIEVIFYPCKHIVCCASCGAAVRECPICRVKVQGMDKVYMS